MPVQVLTSGEVTGSLRRLRPTPVLAKERFKSLQKRGIIEPRRKAQKKGGQKILYQTVRGGMGQAAGGRRRRRGEECGCGGGGGGWPRERRA